ncbi:MAG: hypothetical protein ACK5LL_11480, partial [Suipraeoptans sp.]
MTSSKSFSTIGYIFSLILADNFDACINSLSSACDLPIQQTRKYISVLFQNKILLSHLSSTPDALDDDDLTTSAELFRNRLANGECDDAYIYLIDMENFTNEYLLLPIAPIEVAYMKTTYPNLLQNHLTSIFETKDSIDSIPKNILEKQDTIQEAIAQNKCVDFMYN